MSEMRLIDANALLENYGLKAAKKYGNKTEEELENSYDTLMKYEVRDMIEDAPTVEAVPLRHAFWTEVKSGDKAFDYYFRCSCCNANTPDKAYSIAPDWCPYCGAMMDGGSIC